MKSAIQISFALLIIGFSVDPVFSQSTQCNRDDRCVLERLYAAWDGDNWLNKTNWNSTAPLDEWYGVTTDPSGRVHLLHLNNNNLTGEIPPIIGELTEAIHLQLIGNNLHGQLPSELGNLYRMQYMFLMDNAFTGELPDLSSLTRMRGFGVTGSPPEEIGLVGQLPEWIGAWTNLQELFLSGNMFTGGLPATWGVLSRLEMLFLQANSLQGPVPQEWGGMTSLWELRLHHNPELTGGIPQTFVNLQNIEFIGFAQTKMCVDPEDGVILEWLNARPRGWEGSVCLPDLDGDLVADSQDNCVDVYNPGQADRDQNAVGDACDVLERDWSYAHTAWALEVPNHDDWNLPFPTFKHGGARSLSGPHDLDGDGKVEVLLGDYSGGGRVHVIENVGNDDWEIVYSSPEFERNLGNGIQYQNARGLGVGDWDGDGLGEFFFLSGFQFPAGTTYSPGLYFFEATGADNGFATSPSYVWEFEPGFELDRAYTDQFVMADIDGDGKNELIFGNNSASNDRDEWWVLELQGDLGSGNESVTVERHLSSRSTGYDGLYRGGGSPYGSSVGDFDGDGQPDVALQSWNSMNFTTFTATGPDTYADPAPNDDAWEHATPGLDYVALFGCLVHDVNVDGDDELFCPSLQSGNVSLLNFEAGESVLQLTAGQVKGEFLEGLANLHMVVGDLNQDGKNDLIGSGFSTFSPENAEQSESPDWLSVRNFGGPGQQGLDVEDVNNYPVLNLFDFSSEATQTVFDRVYCLDGQGQVYNEFLEPGPYSSEFVSRLAYLGDADGDGDHEVAASFQGVDDYVHVYEEFGACTPGIHNERRLIGKHPNPRRTFMRIFEIPAVGVPTELPDQNSNSVPDLLESEFIKLTSLAGLLEDLENQEAVQDAFDAVDKAADSELWQDAVTLDPQFGHKVYAGSKDATEALSDIEGESDSAQALAKRIAIEIVEVVAIVAETAVKELAYVCGTDRKCLRGLEKAQIALENAGVLEDNLRWSHAIDRYRQAWQEATDELDRGLSKADLGEGDVVVTEELPTQVTLSNYPNPFNPTTTIDFALPETQEVSLLVFDLLGRQVKELVNGVVEAGYHAVRFDATSLPSGSYIYRLQTKEGSISKQMTLLR